MTPKDIKVHINGIHGLGADKKEINIFGIGPFKNTEEVNYSPNTKPLASVPGLA